jgi:S1-C subfamily serine protease
LGDGARGSPRPLNPFDRQIVTRCPCLLRRGDALAAPGFADGDVILRVNGVEIASPDRCPEAYARLRRADRVTVTFERRGRRRSHVYALVEGA